MLKLTTAQLELRGLKNQTSKKGNVYYMLFCETEEGEPCKFFCKDSRVFPEGLKKGDQITLDLHYNAFKELDVLKVNKVGL